jgi:hypothetical protein
MPQKPCTTPLPLYNTRPLQTKLLPPLPQPQRLINSPPHTDQNPTHNLPNPLPTLLDRKPPHRLHPLQSALQTRRQRRQFLFPRVGTGRRGEVCHPELAEEFDRGRVGEM